MVQLSTLLASVTVFALATALPSGGHTSYKAPAKGKACPAPATGSKGTAKGAATAPKAVYFMTNAAANSIVALKVAADGTLSDGSVTATGGAGLNGIDQTKGGPAAPDALFSQGAVKVAGNTLLAVNPGSNTVSMFSISTSDPTKLTMVGKPVDTQGEFPVSVTISTALKQACVANSGAVAGVSCFSVSSKGLAPLGELRPICLGQTTPPTGPFNTVSQVAFTADSTNLVTTVKGDPTKNNTGFISLFPVAGGSVSTTSTDTSPPGTAVLFGFALLPASNSLLVTDASFGATTLNIDKNESVSTQAVTKIADQAATCWAALSPATSSVFVTDVGVNHLVEIDPASGSILSVLNSTNGNPGMIDLAAAGNFIYALSPGTNATQGANVAVFDVSQGKGKAKEIQNFAVAGVGSASQGMTLL